MVGRYDKLTLTKIDPAARMIDCSFKRIHSIKGALPLITVETIKDIRFVSEATLSFQGVALEDSLNPLGEQGNQKLVSFFRYYRPRCKFVTTC